MKKIFVNTPFASDANSFWRCLGPLTYMEKVSGGEIQIVNPPNGIQVHWDYLSQFDLLFMHRPCRAQDITVMHMARLLNIPVWCDYDDWLLHIPDWNPHRDQYHQEGVQHVIGTALACSDIVTCSTTALLKKFEKVNPRTIIMPNAYRSDLFPYRKTRLQDRENIYVWRGTNTHDGDILPMIPAFKSLSQKIHLLGGPPYVLTSQLERNNYKTHGPVDPILYWKTIYEMKPKVWLFPLKDDFFNHCKSNISWLEAIHAGAICVAPDMPEWKHCGVVTYERDNAKSFYDAAESAMAMSESEIRQSVEMGMSEIEQSYDIRVVNQHRTHIFEAIFHPSFERNTRDPLDQMNGMWALSQLKSTQQQLNDECLAV